MLPSVHPENTPDTVAGVSLRRIRYDDLALCERRLTLGRPLAPYGVSYRMWRLTPARRGVDDALGHRVMNTAIVHAACVVAHGHEEQNRQPEYSGDNDRFRALRTVLRMHEEQHDEAGL